MLLLRCQCFRAVLQTQLALEVLIARKSTGKSIRAMRKFRTLDAVEADYLRDHPDEMEEYMSVIFEEPPCLRRQHIPPYKAL